MNVVIYARYSDSKQREESIEGQLKVCYKYAEDAGYVVIREYIDRAQSAKTADRPQFQKMIRDSEKKEFQGVLVYRLDRFSRNRYDSSLYKHILKENGVAVISANERISDDPTSIMFESMIEALAEFYSAELAQKVVRGMLLNAEKGLYNGGTLPLGFKIVNQRYEIDEQTAPIVREIFTKYANGASCKEIYDSLNERQLKTSRRAIFNKSSLHTILKNKKYLGIYTYNGMEIPNMIPAIISQELFDKVAERMKANKEAPARSRAKAEYLLTGKIFCGHCKEKMIGHSSNQISKKGVIFNYYKCKNSGRAKSCHKKMIGKDVIETIVVEECRKLLTPQNIRKIALEVAKISRNMEDRTELKRLEGQLKQTEDAKNNQMIALRSCTNDLVRNMLLEDLNKIAIEMKELEKQIEIEKARHHIVTEEQVTTYLGKLANGDINKLAYRKALIKMFVNKIYVYDDKYTIVFQVGDEEVTISDGLLDKIEKSLSGEKLCLLNGSGHQSKKTPMHRIGVFLLGDPSERTHSTAKRCCVFAFSPYADARSRGVGGAKNIRRRRNSRTDASHRSFLSW